MTPHQISKNADIVGDARLGGPFEANWGSLRAGYQAPDWYRDAKFGLWAHWGPQCVPEAGDWYARNMYIPGHPQYAHHLARYGHPAGAGFMEIINQWRAERWDPDELLSLYARAGAKYFVAMANHHDNFDNWDSSWHDWNSVKVGPRRDIIGTWAQKAREHGLRFGVSNHATRTWHWFQTAYGYDPEGNRAGERYDAYRLGRRDGNGKWWDGLDPQELYGGAMIPPPDGLTTIGEMGAWYDYDTGANKWTEQPPLANPIFVRNWYRRCKELVDRYDPDLLYFDNFDLPLGQAGLDIAAHYYNASVARRGGLDVVLNTKELPHERQGALVEDVERGYRAEIVPHVWQTDTCIGEWHYNRQVFERKSYMKADSVIHRLCDVVSKNGNLLLSIPMRGDGTIDSEERAIVEDVGSWMERFGTAIHGTRPWRIYGEGPTEVIPGMFSESAARPFTARDIRFTTKEGDLFATTLGRAGTIVTIESLVTEGLQRDVAVERVELVGELTPLTFTHDRQGLHIEVPQSRNHEFGVAFRIRGRGLVSQDSR